MGANMNFEKEVYNAIQNVLNKGELVWTPNFCRVFYHKSYRSQNREKEIITDIAIEMFLPKALKPSIIWVWECKDCQESIPVDDIKEFHAKLEQIGADKTKGTIITSQGAFQKSSLDYARAKGIGVARLMPDDQLEWILYQITFDMKVSYVNEQAVRVLSNVNYKSRNQSFYGFTLDSFVNTTGTLEGYIQLEMNKLNKVLTPGALQ